MFSSQETEGNWGMLLEDHSDSHLVRREKKKKKNHAAIVERKEASLRLQSATWLYNFMYVCNIWTIFAVQKTPTHSVAWFFAAYDLFLFSWWLNWS